MWDYFKMWGIWGRIGIIIGILGALVGVGVTLTSAIIRGDIVEIIFVIVFTLIFVSVFYFAFRATLGSEVARRRIIERGIPAEAAILEFHETGVTMQQGLYYLIRFVLEVRPKDKPAYRAETKALISRMTMAQLQPGVVVPVMIDRNNPKKVAILEKFSAEKRPAAVPSKDQQELMQKMVNELAARDQEIRKIGVSAIARIISATPTGIEINGPNPLMSFMIEVQPADKPKFVAEVKGAISQASVPKFQPGNMIYVKYDPNDLSRVAIERSA